MGRRKRHEWQTEFDHASAALADEPGTFVWATDAYVAFRYIEPGVRIVFYPHRTTARNYHIRCRTEPCSDMRRAEVLMKRLDDSKPGWCTFTRKNR